jgi:hypothetical protein
MDPFTGWVYGKPGDEAEEGAPYLAQRLEAARDQAVRDLDRQAEGQPVAVGAAPAAILLPVDLAGLLASNLQARVNAQSVFNRKNGTGLITCV